MKKSRNHNQYHSKKSKAYATYKHNINKMSKTDLEQLDEEIVVDMNADYSDEF